MCWPKAAGQLHLSFCPFSSHPPCVQRKSCLPSETRRGWDVGFGRGDPGPDFSLRGLPLQVAGDTLSPKHFCINASKLTSQAVVSYRHSLTLPGTGRTRTGRGRAGGGNKKKRGMSHQSRQIASKSLKLSGREWSQRCYGSGSCEHLPS